MKKGDYLIYEWAIYLDCTETLEDDGSTSIDYDGDVDFNDTYACVAGRGDPDKINVIELQRSHRSGEDGDLIERYYAVVKDGELPEFFDGTQIHIPKRFHKEVKKYHEELDAYTAAVSKRISKMKGAR